MFTLNCRGRLLIFDKPVVMGIINATPDSFFSGSRVSAIDAAVERAGRMLSDGASILDIGGQSTRPGSEMVDEAEELQRVVPVVKAIHERYPEALLSIDTFYGGVAAAALDAGASIINDVSAATVDPGIIEVAVSTGAPYVLMHMQGNPQTMQQAPFYEDVVQEVFDFLSFRIDALHRSGIKDIIVDPGFGFGKTATHNFEILRRLSYFTNLRRPLMIGLSRKATVYKTLGVTPEEALNGSTVLHTIGLMNGANIIRVHDVKETVEAVQLIDAYHGKSSH